ncbi:hypothetical protein BH11BAC6_BH11BAC6_11990 [soil metagenome]
MKIFTAILLTALLGYAAPLYFEWWSFAVTSFIVALFIYQRPWPAFVSGFFGLFLLWMVQASVIDTLNDHLLSQKVAAIFGLTGGSVAIILISAFIGALVSAFAALTASFARTKAK